MVQVLSPAACGLEWSEWIALDAPLAAYQRCITRDPGFYRVRIVGRDALAYIGETGRNIRQRSRALALNAGHSADDPPRSDPHAAAPNLWAWRIEEGLEYEDSVASRSPEDGDRKGMEQRLLYEYRVTAVPGVYRLID